MLEELKRIGFSEEEAQKVVDNQDKIENAIVKDKYVPLHKFNEINDDLKTANETIKQKDIDIEDIRLKVGDNETLKKEIEDLQKTRKEESEKATSERERIRKETAVKLEIIGKVHDVDDVVSKLDLSRVELDGETTKIKSGFTEQYETLKKEKSYLFIQDKPAENQSKKPFIKGVSLPREGSETNNVDGGKTNAGVELAKKLAQNKVSNVVTDDYYFGGNNRGGNE